MIIRLFALAVPIVLVVVLGGMLISSCTNSTATTSLNFDDGFNQHNPKAEAEATAIAQQAFDDAERRWIERRALQAQAETEMSAQGAALVGKSTFYFLGWTGAGIGALVMLIGLAFALVALMSKRATTIYPNKQGQYPLVERRGLGWIIIHDPSRAIGPGAVYRVPSLADVLTSRLRLAPAAANYPMPEVSEQSLLAASSQANAIAVTAAQNRWPRLPEFLAKSIRLDNTHLPSAGDPPPAELPAPSVAWPSRVPLRGLLAGQPPSLSNLVLGVTVQPDGRVEPVRGDMAQMVHVLAAGASGWGKSQFLKMLLYQLASSSDPCSLVLADLERLTFAEFARCGRLMFPIIDSERDLTAVLRELAAEVDRRKAAFGQFEGVDTLADYNAHADAPLPPIVLAIDEASEFLHDGQVADAIKPLARRGRKYGLWLALGGQTFNSKDVATSTSLMFSTRCQFRAPVVTSSQTIVGDKEARALECPGRAILVLPGRDPVKVQAPFVTRDEILIMLDNGRGPQRAMPAPTAQPDEDMDAKIRLMAGDGLSRSQIAQQLFGSTGGAAYYRVKRALELSSTSTDDAEIAPSDPVEVEV